MELAYQLLNYTLSFLFWLILGRALLNAMTGGRRNFFSEAMGRVTDPVIFAVRCVVPAFVDDRYIPLLTLPLLLALRIILLPLLRVGS